MERVRRLVAAPAAALALPLGLAAILTAASGTLPGGSSITVQITSPANGAILAEGPVTVSGTASVGEGVPVANTLLVYVLDLSGSTNGAVSGTTCGSQNFDGVSNTILDCEIAAAKALNNAAVAAGTVFEIGAVGFAGQTSGNGNLNAAFKMDLSPASGIQNLVAPNANANSNAQLDLDEVLFRVDTGGIIQLFTPANIGSVTNYWAAVHRAVEVANASSATNKIVVFLSDGVSNAGGPAGEPVLDALEGVSGITFHTFAISNLVACTPAGSNKGTLQQIANATGGTCTELDNPADAIEALPAVIGSSLTGVSVAVNGGASSPAATVPALPLDGPANAAWDFTTGVLTPGAHQLCATASGSDGGGDGGVTHCVTVQVNAPPSCGGVFASPASLWPPNNKFVLVTLSGGSDPDGDDITVAVTGVSQDETVSAGGDASLAGGNKVNLRASRLGSGDGRVYEVGYTITDAHGATCSGSTLVGVPHDSSGGAAVDSGVRFSSIP